jgi:hypothetical protein
MKKHDFHYSKNINRLNPIQYYNPAWNLIIITENIMATYNTPIKKIAISTGGGDAPGLNAVIRAAALSAHTRGWEVYALFP